MKQFAVGMAKLFLWLLFMVSAVAISAILTQPETCLEAKAKGVQVECKS